MYHHHLSLFTIRSFVCSRFCFFPHFINQRNRLLSPFHWLSMIAIQFKQPICRSIDRCKDWLHFTFTKMFLYLLTTSLFLSLGSFVLSQLIRMRWTSRVIMHTFCCCWYCRHQPYLTTRVNKEEQMKAKKRKTRTNSLTLTITTKTITATAKLSWLLLAGLSSSSPPSIFLNQPPYFLLFLLF